MEKKKPHLLGRGFDILDGQFLIFPEIVLHNEQVALDPFGLE